MILGYIPQFGTLTQIGTVDFYPGTRKGPYGPAYGRYQPGCHDDGVPVYGDISAQSK